jgi:D-proline reductase (dithiol) PrdA
MNENKLSGGAIMSITAETAKHHANDPAVFCCRAEAGITIGPENLEDPAIFDELVDSGLLNLDGCLTIKEVLGAKLTKTCDSLTPITVDVIDAPVACEEEAAEEAPAPAVEAEVPVMSGSAQGAAVRVSGGKVVLAIKEGKDIYIELPI